MAFVAGQRVRVRQYINWPGCGDPHFIVGHFGHVKGFDHQYVDVQISHGPQGGAVDQRVFDDNDEDGVEGVWAMTADELEAVD